MKFLKKHFTKFLMSFTLAFTSLFVAFGCTTFASPGYTIMPDGVSLDSLNLFDISKLNDNNLIRLNEIDSYNVTIENITISTTNNANDPFMYFANVITLTSGTYTFSFESDSIIQQIGLVFNGSTTYIHLLQRVDSGSVSFIINDTTTFGFGVELYSGSSTFNIMLNEGNEALDFFPYWNGVNANIYNQLEDSYNTIQNDYNNLKNRYNYGFFADLSTFTLVGFSNGVQVINDSYILQDLINQNLFSNGTFLLNNFISSIGVSYDNASIKFDFAPNLIPNNVDITFVGNVYYNFNFQITYSNNQYIVFPITEENNFISHTELNNYSIASGNAPISNFKFSFNNGQYIPNMNFSTDYANAYNTGFSDGQNASYSTIQQLENNINDLNSQVANMSNTISTLQIAYNDLNTSYENMLSGNNFANLFFTISETPFASFKQIWNVDFLGVNLAGFVTGILFLGLVIWVIKKIF